MTIKELMRLCENFDESFDLSEFSPQEIEQMLNCKTQEEFKRKYFDFYDDVKDKSLKKQDW